jgi:hypothetical protein
LFELCSCSTGFGCNPSLFFGLKKGLRFLLGPCFLFGGPPYLQICRCFELCIKTGLGWVFASSFDLV